MSAGTAAGTGGRLHGRRILVLRPQGQGKGLAEALEAEGASAVIVPAIRILPPADWHAIDAALARSHDWTVFTSVNGVAALGGRLEAAVGSGRVAAVGPATAQALAASGVSVNFVPTAFTTAALAEQLPGPGTSVCLVRADIAGGDLEAILASRGFAVDRIDAYRSEEGDLEAVARALGEGVDAVALTSASIVAALAAAASGPGDLGPAAAFSIGPATTAACHRAGIEVAAEARPHTIPGLVAVMADHLGPAQRAQWSM